MSRSESALFKVKRDELHATAKLDIKTKLAFKKGHYKQYGTQKQDRRFRMCHIFV